MRAIVMLLLVTTLLAACGQDKKEEKPGGASPMAMALPVSAIEVQPTTIPISAEAVAQTEGAKEVEIRPRVGGILLKRLYEEGDPVKQGQAMFLIDPEPYKIALSQARAALAEQEARIEQARREEARLKGLLATQSISQREYDTAVSDLAVARATAQRAEANVREAELNLSYTTVTAPVGGISGRFRFSEGALVEPNTSLLTTIVQLSPIWVRFSFSDTELAQLGGRLNEQNVKEVSLVLPDGSVYKEKGKLNFAASEIDPTLGTQQLRATFENKDRRLLPGQFVRARVVTGQREGVFLLPQPAVMTSDQGNFVYVVNAQNQANPQPVTTGNWVGKEWVVLDGLNAGDQVIVDNLLKVRPGMTVSPQLPGAKPTQGAAPQSSSSKQSQAK
ncbi:MAG TPA: efflux RND transporter periplasmic adaptor subunit [Methylophilaceae bacterium]|nr:efflux RND transporter periplasmic adaptor subunit [Methylophilaceae bacterium]